MTTGGEVATNRAADVLIGAAVGDALGWPQEYRGNLVGGQRARDQLKPRAKFLTWQRTSGHYTKRSPDPVRAGDYSDDTQLLCASARACLHGDDWLRWLTEVELPTWPVYQRGGGGAVIRACRSWSENRPPWYDGDARGRKLSAQYFQAGANGVAMRIAPHVLREPHLPAAFSRVIGDGVLTHGHPRALIGGLVYAAALHASVRNEAQLEFGALIQAARHGLLTFEQVIPDLPTDWPSAAVDAVARTWGQVINEVEDLLDKAVASVGQGAVSNPQQLLEAFGCTDPKVNGSGTVTAVAAVYLASRFAARPLSGLLTAAFLRKGDTDTLASMTTALLAAIQGSDWMEDLDEQVQDNHYLADLGHRVVRREVSVKGVQKQPFFSLMKHFTRELSSLANSSVKAAEGVFPDGRGWRLARRESLGVDRLYRLHLALSDGQTVLVDVTAEAERNGQGILHIPAQQEEPSAPAVDTASANPMLGDTRPVRPATGLTEVTLYTADLGRNAAFYAQLLDREIPIVHGTARISDWLLLRASQNPGPVGRGELHFVIADLASAARALGGDPTTRLLRVLDPDGRRLVIGQA